MILLCKVLFGLFCILHIWKRWINKTNTSVWLVFLQHCINLNSNVIYFWQNITFTKLQQKLEWLTCNSFFIFLINIAAMSSFLSLRASLYGMSLYLSRASTFASWSNSLVQTLLNLFFTAKCNGVAPFSSTADGFALRWSSEKVTNLCAWNIKLILISLQQKPLINCLC